MNEGENQILCVPEPCCDVELKREEPSVLARLARRKQSLEKQMAEVDAALKALEEMPGLNNALTTIGRVLGRL